MEDNALVTLAQRVISLRRLGRIEEAAKLLEASLPSHHVESALLVETLKIALIRGKLDEAYANYLELQLREVVERGEHIEWRTRLALAMQLPLPSLEPRQEPPSKWFAAFVQTGTDTLFRGAIAGIRPHCYTGVLNYELTIRCASCDSTFSEILTFNFLFSRERLCPCCFAQLITTTTDLQRYFVDVASIERLDIVTSDEEFLVILQDLGVPGFSSSRVPALVQYLNQDYVYLLTHNIYASEARAGRPLV